MRQEEDKRGTEFEQVKDHKRRHSVELGIVREEKEELLKQTLLIKKMH